MVSDPRSALAIFAASILAILLYAMQYLNVPETLIPLVTAALSAGARLGEVWFDSRNKVKAVTP